jgi:hypothetical protein
MRELEQGTRAGFTQSGFLGFVFWLGVVNAAAVSACGGGSSDSGGGGGTSTGGKPSVILDGGGTIPDPPDGAAQCQSGSCNYQTQDCPNGGSCLPTDTPPDGGDWPPKCFTPGQAGPGASCSAWNDCIAGYFCVGIGYADGGVVPGTCRKLCCGGDWSACPSGESCVQQVELARPSGGTPVYANADICVPVGGCDPLVPTSCTESGKTCQIVDPIGDVACFTEGNGGQGASCSPSNRCKGGFVCVQVTGQSDYTCRRLCRAVEGGGSPACQANEGICVHFKRDPQDVGECTPAS